MILSAKKISKSLGDPPQSILKEISFDIRAGEFVALKGRSGSGKSTLLYILSTLDVPTSGELWIQDHRVKDLDSRALHRLRNQTIGFVFQFHYLLPELTALENVLMPARKSGVHLEKAAFANELMKLFDLENHAHKLPRQMSGGQNQRVAIARALIMRPKLIFADEPTGSLDSVNSERVFQILEKVNQEFGTTLVMVTHDDSLSKRAGRIIELMDGQVSGDHA